MIDLEDVVRFILGLLFLVAQLILPLLKRLRQRKSGLDAPDRVEEREPPPEELDRWTDSFEGDIFEDVLPKNYDPAAQEALLAALASAHERDPANDSHAPPLPQPQMEQSLAARTDSSKRPPSTSRPRRQPDERRIAFVLDTVLRRAPAQSSWLPEHRRALRD